MNHAFKPACPGGTLCAICGVDHRTSDVTVLRTIDLESDPHYGFDQVELYGEPFDAIIATLDADSGLACERCGAHTGSSTYDDFTDDGHRMAAQWTWMTLVANEAVVWALCEGCSMALAPKMPDA